MSDRPAGQGRGRLLVGTSGWSYDHWAGSFYPNQLPARERLAYYATRFATVEVNATFYRLPTEATVRAWRDAVPDDFRFSVKGSRLVTHFRRLEGVDDAVREFFGRVGELGPRLAVVLWQLPPTLRRDDERLARFLECLPASDVRFAIEFRHETWLAEETFEVLRRYGAAAVWASGDVMRTEFATTADFAYARFHGTAAYHGAYERPSLEPWVARLETRLATGHDCYAYFNNDAEGHAPVDAARLLSMLESRASNQPGRV